MRKQFPLAVPIVVTLLACAALTASAQTYGLTPDSTTNSSVSALHPGYVLQSDGSYYNSSNGMYYDASTGNYSTTDPANSPATATPGLPNTGAGGNAVEILTILGVLIVIAIAGIAYTARKT